MYWMLSNVRGAILKKVSDSTEMAKFSGVQKVMAPSDFKTRGDSGLPDHILDRSQAAD
jgi:hypothetical protein